MKRRPSEKTEGLFRALLQAPAWVELGLAAMCCV
jgi:hypothetical protein